MLSAAGAACTPACLAQKPPVRQASTSPQSQQPPPDENIQKSCPVWSAPEKHSWQTAHEGSMPQVRQWYTMSPVFQTMPQTPGVAGGFGGWGRSKISLESVERARERGEREERAREAA
eukprot:scaffold230752_cov28-Tisochrysis_lutea.AAC.5